MIIIKRYPDSSLKIKGCNVKTYECKQLRNFLDLYGKTALYNSIYANVWDN